MPIRAGCGEPGRLQGTETEAVIGDVERPIRADGHAGREHQARDDSDW